MTENNRIKMEALATALIFLRNTAKLLDCVLDRQTAQNHRRGAGLMINMLGWAIFEKDFDHAALIKQAKEMDVDMQALPLETILNQVGLERSGE